MLTCGEAAVRLLEAYGVDLVFGIPGAQNLELYRGLAKSGIRHVSTRHEQGAGFMADGFARSSGTPGVCFVIGGPGLTNVATPMGQAYSESVPMLVLSGVGRTDTLDMGRGTTHELRDQSGLAAHVTASSHTVLAPAQLPELVAEAFAMFACRRPRPVHIEIPTDVAEMPADFEPVAWPTPSPPSPQPSAIAEAARMLASAERPAVVLGGGTVNAAREARDVVEMLDSPTVLTTNAKGILPRGHGLSLGSNLQFAPVRSYVESADVVLAVGTEFGETDTQLFDEDLNLGGQLIRIDIEASQLARAQRPTLAIVSDAGEGLAALTEALRGMNGARPRSEEKVTGLVRAIRTEARNHWWPGTAVFARLLDVITDSLPSALIVGDSTQPAYAFDHLFEPPEPRSYMTATMGYGTLGFALPAAMGAKLGSPSRPVVAVIGDAGVQFTLPELATAVQEHIPVVVLVWKNRGYEEIRVLMTERGIPSEGFRIEVPDFVVLAQGFGCQAAVARDGEELSRLLAQYWQLDVPLVIEVDEEALSG
jgi:acetolactate synthase-1/2/3 large subunit